MLIKTVPYDSDIAPFSCSKPGRDIPCDALLIRTGDCNILWDTDFAFTGERLAQRVKEALKGETLHYILISHSHYDHAAGAPFIKALYPEAQVIAGTNAANVFRKESARQKMLELDDNVALLRGESAADREIFHQLKADITVGDGDMLFLGRHRVKVVEVPGHTRDCVCYYFEDEDFLLGNETLGVYMDGDMIAMHMLLGSIPTIASLQKILAMDVGMMVLPHATGIVPGKEECRRFFEKALEATEDTRALVWTAAENGSTAEEITAQLTKKFCEGVSRDPSVVRSMETNARFTTLALLREWEQQNNIQ